MATDPYHELLLKELAPTEVTAPAAEAPPPTAAAPPTETSPPSPPTPKAEPAPVEPEAGDLYATTGIPRSEIERYAQSLPEAEREPFVRKVKGLEKGMHLSFTKAAQAERRAKELEEKAVLYDKAKLALSDPRVQQAITSALQQEFSPAPQAPAPNLDDMTDAERTAYLVREEVTRILEADRQRQSQQFAPLAQTVEQLQTTIAEMTAEREKVALRSRIPEIVDYEDRIALWYDRHPDAGIPPDEVYKILKHDELSLAQVEAQKRDLDAKRRLVTEQPRLSAAPTVTSKDYSGPGAAEEIGKDVIRELQRQGRFVDPQLAKWVS